MAGPPGTERKGNMLEVEVTSSTPAFRASSHHNGLHGQVGRNGQNVTVSMSVEGINSRASRESALQNRASRESVLQRLSDALMGRSLTKIDLSQRGLQSIDARLVKMALSSNENLTVLKLGYNNLGDDGVESLASGIAEHRALNLLDLGFNNFGDKGAKELATAMREASRAFNGGSLRTLYLAGNLIGEDGAMAMADFIRHGSRLRKLYMTGNRIGSDGVGAITEAILEDEKRREEELLLQTDCGSPASEDTKTEPNKSAFHGMQELFLGGTGMGSMGCMSVARLFEQSSSLRVISLPNCGIGDEEVKMLAASIKSNKERIPLESIQLSFNTITQQGLEKLSNAIFGLETLRELKVDNNEIGDRGAHHVAAILPSVKGLAALDVGFNAIKTDGLNALMKAVSTVRNLKALSVSGNAIDVPAAKAIAYALAYNSSLQSLLLVHCSINNEAQRHIGSGVVSNKQTSLRSLTGFALGPVVVSLGFPDALRNSTNEQVMIFIHAMYDKPFGEGAEGEFERDLDPLNFLPGLGAERSNLDTRPPGPLEPAVVVETARKTYSYLVANGVDIFSRRRPESSFGSPLASDAGLLESSPNGPPPLYPGAEERKSAGGQVSPNGSDSLSKSHGQSFVAPPETNNEKAVKHDPARKQRIVEWLCANMNHIHELAQRPFDPRELWILHQHYFTPVVNESGGSVPPAGPPGSRVVSSVPDVYRGAPGGSTVTPSSHSSEEQIPVQASDPVLPGGQVIPTSLPMLKRKVSYHVLSDATGSSMRVEPQSETHLHRGAVAKLIEDGHTKHTLPPKTKKARRNRTRISFLPRIKAKLDSYMDVGHDKALITMRQLRFVEQSILSGSVVPLETSLSVKTHLCGPVAAEAEMIIVDMI